MLLKLIKINQGAEGAIYAGKIAVEGPRDDVLRSLAVGQN